MTIIRPVRVLTDGNAGIPGANEVKSFVDWNCDVALPLWATRGFDAGAGRFVERLDHVGKALPVPQRAMVQARQIYVYAHAAELGWYAPGAARADAAMAALRRNYCDESADAASVAFSIDPHSGEHLSTTRDAYTHAFVLFAIAHLYRFTRDAALLDFALRIATFVARNLIDPDHGGAVDALPAVSNFKRQNPQMHLLEAYLALEAAAPGRGWLERADTVVALFHDRLTMVESGVLLEHFAHDWSPHPDPVMRTVFEPGHHYEWAWLLDRHRQLSGRDHGQWCRALHATAARHGHAPSGLIYDEVNADGTVAKHSHRLWPHTEAIKAAAIRYRAGHHAALGEAQRMAALLCTHFLDTPFTGGWTDQISPTGEALVDYVPASSLYHLFLAATEADQIGYVTA